MNMQLLVLYFTLTVFLFLQDMWIGILHHVVNEHDWVLEEGNNGGECDHAPLNEDEQNKPWLKEDSLPHKALTKIILDKWFLNTIPYYINFRYSINPDKMNLFESIEFDFCLF